MKFTFKGNKLLYTTIRSTIKSNPEFAQYCDSEDSTDGEIIFYCQNDSTSFLEFCEKYKTCRNNTVIFCSPKRIAIDEKNTLQNNCSCEFYNSTQKSVLLFIYLRNIINRSNCSQQVSTKSSNLFDCFVQNWQFPVIILNITGIIQDVNNATDTFLGFSKEELIGKSIDWLTKDIDVQNIPSIIAELQDVGQLTKNIDCSSKNDSSEHLESLQSKVRISLVDDSHIALMFDSNNTSGGDQEIVASESYYRFIFENFSTPVFTVTRNGRIVDANTPAIAFLQVENQLKLHEVNALEFPILVDSGISAAILDGFLKKVKFENRFWLRHDNSFEEINIQFLPIIRKSNEKNARLVCVFSASRQQEQLPVNHSSANQVTIQMERQSFAHFFGALLLVKKEMHNGIESDFKIESFSNAAKQLLGDELRYGVWLSKFKKMPLLEYVHAFEKKTQREFVFFSVNPPASYIIRIANSGKTNFIINFQQDMDKFQAQLQSQYKLFFDTIALGLVATDLKGIIQFCNPAFAKIHGYEIGELKGLNIDKISPILKPVFELESNKQSVEETFNKHKDGQSIPMRYHWHPLRNQSGSLVNFIFVFEDIKEQFDQREELKLKQSELIHTSRLAALGEVASGILHEINQPLTYIQTVIESLSEDFLYEDIDSESAKMRLQEALRQVSRINDINFQLRNYSRRDEQNMELVSTEHLITNSVMILRQAMQKHDIEFQSDIHSDLPKLQCYPNQIEQVIINIVKNAIDVLKSKSGERKIVISDYLDESNHNLYIKICDNGGGILPEHRNKIFDSFFTTKSSGEGTGLGLSISRRIIEVHGGSLHFESTMNEGTDFYIALPIC